MSVMEMSHRSPEFESIIAAAEAGLRKHLAIPEEYAVLFLQGGGSMQFTMAPMNLCLPGKPVDLIHTGTWTAKALGELKKGILHNVAASTEAEKFARLPRKDEIKYSPDASYVHMCTNNTIEGTQWTEMPVDRRRAARCGHVFGYRFTAYRREEIRADLCGRAEKSWTERRHRRDRAQGSGRARGQESADDSAIPHATSRRSRCTTRRRRLRSTSWGW